LSEAASLRQLIDIAIAVAIATVLGFSTAWIAVEHGRIFGAVTVGAWTAWPGAGGPDADPYSVALLARTGELPLGAGEGLPFTATTDDEGEPLSGGCDYLVSGQTPPARLWTLTAYDAEGRLMRNAAQRAGFHSREILRKPDGTFAIAISPDVEPGNWLPITRVGGIQLVLRLYDTPLTTATEFVSLEMPRIEKEQCE
jgi:hypothetical protein